MKNSNVFAFMDKLSIEESCTLNMQIATLVPKYYEREIEIEELNKLNNSQLYYIYYYLIRQEDESCTEEEDMLSKHNLNSCEKILKERNLTIGRCFPPMKI